MSSATNKKCNEGPMLLKLKNFVPFSEPRSQLSIFHFSLNLKSLLKKYSLSTLGKGFTSGLKTENGKFEISLGLPLGIRLKHPLCRGPPPARQALYFLLC